MNILLQQEIKLKETDFIEMNFIILIECFIIDIVECRKYVLKSF